MMMQFGKINQPVSDFQAQRQILTLCLNSQHWEIPFNWDFGRDRDAIDPVEQITAMIERYLPFLIDSVEVDGDRVSVYLNGKQIDVTI
jgi:hypothetical protein